MSRILIIEDDPALVDLLGYNTRKAGYEVDVAYDGKDGLAQAQRKKPDLVVLDLMLPVMDGLEVCRRLRNDPQTSEIMILMLTAMSEEGDQLVGFSAGTDDYVTKPYSIRLLLERIRALEPPPAQRRGRLQCRRRQSVRRDGRPPPASSVGRRAGVEPDTQRVRATRHAHPATRPRVLPCRTCQRRAGADTIVLERTIDVHVRALRLKLGDNADVIETIRGVGYRFRERPV